MQQASQSSNFWLEDYIKQNYQKKSRYDIDKYLLEAGFDGAEIEAVWKNLAQTNRASEPVKRFSFWQFFLVLIVAVLALIALSITFPEHTLPIVMLFQAGILLFGKGSNTLGLRKRFPKFIDSFTLGILTGTLLYSIFKILQLTFKF